MHWEHPSPEKLAALRALCDVAHAALNAAIEFDDRPRLTLWALERLFAGTTWDPAELGRLDIELREAVAETSSLPTRAATNCVLCIIAAATRAAVDAEDALASAARVLVYQRERRDAALAQMRALYASRLAAAMGAAQLTPLAPTPAPEASVVVPLSRLFAALRARCPSKPALVGLDGLAGSGKSALAVAMGACGHRIRVVPVRSFRRLRGKASLAIRIEDWFDHARLDEEVLAPIHAQRARGIAAPLDEAEVVMVVGVSACSVSLAGRYDLRMWVEVPEAERVARLVASNHFRRRVSTERWDFIERNYLLAHDTAARADLVIDGRTWGPLDVTSAVLVREDRIGLTNAPERI